MGVEGLSIALAKQWGIDPEKALLAALLHDIAKSEPYDRQEQLATESKHFQPTQEDMQLPAMWHGLAAARIAAAEYGINDLEILEAVAWHTTGNKKYGRLGMMLYVADFLEPTRDFDGVETYRRDILNLPLKEATLRVTDLKLNNVRNRNKQTHSRTIAMKEWLENH